MTQLIGSRSSVEFGPGRPVLLINDQLRVYDQAPQVLAELAAGRCDYLAQLAREGAAAGCQAVDILIDHPALAEADVLPRVVQAVDAAVGCPISLDSRNPDAIERALEGYTGKALLNSISGEAELLNALLPLVARHGMAVVALLVDDVQVPQTWQERLAVARAILARADDAGIPRDDIVFDSVCMAASTLPGSLHVTLDTLAAIHSELGMSTILGIGNAGFGMPDQTRIDLAYLVAAVPWGLDAALVDYHTENLLVAARAIDFLSARDPAGANYISLYRATRPRRRARSERHHVPGTSQVPGTSHWPLVRRPQLKPPIDWHAVAAPLDVASIPPSQNHLRCWTRYTITPTGVVFDCETGAGDEAIYRVDLIEPDVVRVRMARTEHATQLADRRSEMLIRAGWRAIPFACSQAAGCVTLTTARLRLEFRQFPWQFRAYAATSPPAPLLRGEGSDVPFFAERVDDRAYGPGYEVLPVGFEPGIGGREAVREAVAVTPGEAFYGFGEKFTPLDKWGQADLVGGGLRQRQLPAGRTKTYRSSSAARATACSSILPTPSFTGWAASRPSPTRSTWPSRAWTTF